MTVKSSASPIASTRDKPWIFRTYSGHSTAAKSNALYKMNLGKGQTGLSIAFDLPTQTGYDSEVLLGLFALREGSPQLVDHPAEQDFGLDALLGQRCSDGYFFDAVKGQLDIAAGQIGVANGEPCADV